MTAREVIKASLRLIGAIASGETPSAAEISDGLGAMNRMLSSWSTQGLTIFKFEREVFQLTAGKSKYTMGPMGDFNTTRPVKIVEARSSDVDVTSVVNTIVNPLDPLAGGIPDYITYPPTFVTITTVNSVTEMDVEILNIQQYASIQDKNTQSNYAQRIYAEGTAPLETINVWPAPSSATGLVLYSKKTLAPFTDVDDEMTMPPEYEEAVIYNLAVRLCPEFGRPASAETAAFAQLAIAGLKRQNAQTIFLKSDALGVTRNKSFNIISGE